MCGRFAFHSPHDTVVQLFLLPEDTREMIELAEAASVPKGAASNASIIPNP